MITIGDKTLLYSQTFLVKDNEQVELRVPLEEKPDGAHVLIHLIFKPTSAQLGQITWRTENNSVNIECLGWVGPLGSGIAQPVKFTEWNEKALTFNIGHLLCGDDLHAVIFQLYHGGTHG